MSALRSDHIAIARAQEGIDADLFCDALQTTLPLLRRLRDNASGWKFWLRWGMDAIIFALEEYCEHVCPRTREYGRRV